MVIILVLNSLFSLAKKLSRKFFSNLLRDFSWKLTYAMVTMDRSTFMSVADYNVTFWLIRLPPQKAQRRQLPPGIEYATSTQGEGTRRCGIDEGSLCLIEFSRVFFHVEGSGSSLLSLRNRKTVPPWWLIWPTRVVHAYTIQRNSNSPSDSKTSRLAEYRITLGAVIWASRGGSPARDWPL